MFNITPANTKVFLVENLVTDESNVEVTLARELDVEGIIDTEQLAANIAELKEGSDGQDNEAMEAGSEDMVLSHGATEGSDQVSIQIIILPVVPVIYTLQKK